MKEIIKNISIVLIAILLGIAIFVFFLKEKKTEKKVDQPTIINQIEDYDYVLEDNKTKLYKDLFQDLKEVLEQEEVNEYNYAKLIAKMFIVDFYTLDNKVTKNDVGGVVFIHPKHQDNFVLHARDTVYKYVENNIYGDRKQELPIVKSIEESEINQESFKYLDKEDSDAFKVKLTWEYEKDLGYDTEKEIIIVHNDNKLVIIEMK
jgi:hypothetical protein